ncbi:hypothetical protein TRVL_08758 [Trypanosoma vivax]|nr:hypothetical protein TRVL_08758 [Trypanosoma vivax]
MPPGFVARHSARTRTEIDGHTKPNNAQYEVPDLPQHRALHHCVNSAQRQQQRHRVRESHHSRPAPLNDVHKPFQSRLYWHTLCAIAAEKRPSTTFSRRPTFGYTSAPAAALDLGACLLSPLFGCMVRPSSFGAHLL